MIRPFSCDLSIFIISLQFISIYEGNFITIFVGYVFGQNSVLEIPSFKDALPMFMSQKKPLQLLSMMPLVMMIQ